MYSGLSVAEVTSSEPMVNAVAKELATYWPMERELLASILEMLHVLVLTTQAAHGGKNLPKPMRVQRPHFGATHPRASVAGVSQEPSGAPIISMSEFVSRERRGDL